MSDSLLNAKKLRKLILKSSTQAGSGHPTSSLSATDLFSVAFSEGFFKADLAKADSPNNDKLIFSKGHSSPLFFSLFTLFGNISENELMTFRKLNSRLEGHPTMKFPYTEAPTGSLGQGLSVANGIALSYKMDKKKNRVWVLLGDSEMAEGSVWEGFDFASNYSLNNLIVIIDVNRLGQRGETMHGHDLALLEKKASSFGLETVVLDGHDLKKIREGLDFITNSTSSKPKLILAKTLKGKGVSFLEDKEGWHGKVLDEEQLQKALEELE